MANCCTKKFLNKHFVSLTLISSVFGCLLLMGSMFVPRWRVDRWGTASAENLWVFTGFDRREYGLLQVRGSYSQSWTTLTSMVCQFQTLGMVYTAGNAVANAASSAWDWISNGGKREEIANITAGCGSSADCARGFTQHLWNRCTHYEKVQRVSIATMCFTFLGIVMVLAGILVATLTNIKRSGGITFGLFMGGFIFNAVINVVYAVVSDMSFKQLSEDAWFPYPSLAIGYFLHVYGTLFLGVAAGSFGYVVLPQTFAYDPEQEKIDKRNKRLQKMAARNCHGHPGQHPPSGFPQQGGQPQYPPQFMAMAPPAGQADFGMGGPAGGGLQWQGPAQGGQMGVQPQMYGAPAGDFGVGAPQSQGAYSGSGAASSSGYAPQYSPPPSGGFQPQSAGGQYAPQFKDQNRKSVGMPSLK